VSFRPVLADDRDNRASLQIEGHLVEHAPLRARIGERHVLETDAVGEAFRYWRIGALSKSSSVVLEPRQTDGTVQPDPAQKADLADGRAYVSREPRARRQHQKHITGTGVEAARHKDDGSLLSEGATLHAPRCDAA
jgi:hypothetical protein